MLARASALGPGLILAVLAGCGEDDPTCGPGTVIRGDMCLAADGDSDGDADADSDADSDADADAEGDCAGAPAGTVCRPSAGG